MKKIIGKITAVVLSCFLCIGCFVGCNYNSANTVLEVSANGLISLKKSGNGLKFYSSDTGFSDFLNDYYSRHIRDNTDKSIGNVKLGQGQTYQKEWEALYLSWFDSTSSGVNGYDAMYNMSSTLDAVYVDDFGYVASTPNMAYLQGNETNSFAMGWPFIYGRQTGNYMAEFLDSTANWTINGKEDVGYFDGSGFWNYTFKGMPSESLVYEVVGLNESIEYAPMIEIGMKFEDLSTDGARYTNIQDIVLSFKMTDGDYVSMSYYNEAIHNEKINGNGMLRAWFPVYLHPLWNGTLESLRIEIIPEEGEKLNLVSSMNYVRLETDTRVTNNNTWYLVAMEEYLSFTGDKEMLKRNIQDLRKAMMFQLYALDGINGLLKTDYMRGKTTTLVGKNKFGMQGNSWYDVIPTGTVNMQANICFYQSLLAMASIEEYARVTGIDFDAPTIRNPQPYVDGAADIVWSQTPEKLRALAAEVKGNIQKNVADGGLWNPQTGRFAWAIYDADSAGGDEGTAMDYGHTEINLMAVLYDIASDSQKESIMTWLSGGRTVSGDNSTGEDIYFYEFAPRVNTKSNSKDKIPTYTLRNFGLDVQNGGASMHVSYYDILARHKYFGAENSFARLKEIQTWYEKVQGSEGKGYAFYRQYYADMMAEGGNVYKMTGGGNIGPIGLDEEFYESALLYATVPYIYLGLDGAFDTLNIAPELPNGLEYLAMENLMFNDVRYDLYITNSYAVISGVRGTTDSKVRLTFKAETGKKAWVNYQETEYVAKDGYITLELPLAQCVVEIK